MSQVTKDGLSSFTTATAYIQEVKFLSPDPIPSKKARSFYVVKLAVHNGKRKDGKLAYIYPECGISDELVDLIEQYRDHLGNNPTGRIVAKVEIANLRGKPWFDRDKPGVNYRGTLRSIQPIQDDEDAE